MNVQFKFPSSWFVIPLSCSDACKILTAGIWAWYSRWSSGYWEPLIYFIWFKSFLHYISSCLDRHDSSAWYFFSSRASWLAVEPRQSSNPFHSSAWMGFSLSLCHSPASGLVHHQPDQVLLDALHTVAGHHTGLHRLVISFKRGDF